jgi:hypothetical protein
MIVADHRSVRTSLKTLFAVAVTAMFIGGLSVAGLSLRSVGPQAAPVKAPIVREQVIHQRRIRSVTIKPPSPPSDATATSGLAASIASASDEGARRAATPLKVSSRVSPVSHGGENEHESEHETDD